MANRLTKNPIYFDQFNADATLAVKGSPLRIRKITQLSATDGDTFVLKDADGNVITHMTNSNGAGDTYDTYFAEDGQTFSDGVVIDVSACTGMAATDGTDAVWIYLK